jgi:branched-chain amino acid aminotransferase
MVKGKKIKTPPCHGTILPGVTRQSILELARMRGYEAEEAPVSVHEAMEADELFTTGTAVVVCSVGSLTYRGNKKAYTAPGQPGKVALEMYKALTELQTEVAPDPKGWVVPLKSAA